MDLAAPELSANSGLSAVCFPGGPELGEGSAPPGCVADAPKMGWFSSFSQSCWVGGPLDALEGGSGLANTHLGLWGLHRGHPRLVERKRGGGGPSPSVAPSWGGVGGPGCRHLLGEGCGGACCGGGCSVTFSGLLPLGIVTPHCPPPTSCLWAAHPAPLYPYYCPTISFSRRDLSPAPSSQGSGPRLSPLCPHVSPPPRAAIAPSRCHWSEGAGMSVHCGTRVSALGPHLRGVPSRARGGQRAR